MDEKGSITVESAFVIPLFCLIMLAVLSLFQLMEVQLRVYYAMLQACEQSAFSQNDDTIEGNFDFYQERVLEYLGKDWIEGSGIQDASRGLQISWQITEEDCIEIDLNYKVQLPYGLPLIPCHQIYSQRLWNGMDGETKKVEYVYVTDYQSVYHTDLECSYLQIKIKAAEYAQLEQLRTVGGARYIPCEICSGGKDNKIIYITDTGRAWHKKITCYTLMRTIHRKVKEEVSDLHLCVRCAMKGHMEDDKE